MQKLIYWVGALFALLIIIGFALPRTHRVEATIEIDAHQATVFALVNDFRRISQWSPWAENDPNARILYLGAHRGQDASVTWDGAISGGGTQLIAQSRPDEYVEIVLSPGEPGYDTSQGVPHTPLAIMQVEADGASFLVNRDQFGLCSGYWCRRRDEGGHSSTSPSSTTVRPIIARTSPTPTASTNNLYHNKINTCGLGPGGSANRVKAFKRSSNRCIIGVNAKAFCDISRGALFA